MTAGLSLASLSRDDNSGSYRSNRLCVAPGPAVGLQDFLAQTQRFWRDFNELIFGDEFDRLLKIEGLDRHETNGFIGTGRAHVGELLFTHCVYVEVVVAGVLADDH